MAPFEAFCYYPGWFISSAPYKERVPLKPQRLLLYVVGEPCALCTVPFLKTSYVYAICTYLLGVLCVPHPRQIVLNHLGLCLESSHDILGLKKHEKKGTCSGDLLVHHCLAIGRRTNHFSSVSFLILSIGHNRSGRHTHSRRSAFLHHVSLENCTITAFFFCSEQPLDYAGVRG